MITENNNRINMLKWMLTHKGCAIAKVYDNNEMEIIEYYENPGNVSELKKKAKENDCYVVFGSKHEYPQL